MWYLDTRFCGYDSGCCFILEHLSKSIYNDSMQLKPIGIVKSAVTDSSGMPLEGIRSSIQIYQEFELGLRGIEKSTHVIILYWMSLAKRDVLEARPKKVSEKLPKQGVFALRSPSRPNPIGISVVKLLHKEGLIMEVDGLDAIDGTPVLDIKPYAQGLDCFLSARRSDEYTVISSMDKIKAIERLLKEAANFHGEVCVGLAIGTRIAYGAMMALGLSLKEKEVKIECRTRGCLADSIQAISASTNKRFTHIPGEGEIDFKTNTRRITFRVTKNKIHTAKEALTIKDAELFQLKDG